MAQGLESKLIKNGQLADYNKELAHFNGLYEPLCILGKMPKTPCGEGGVFKN